MSLTQKLNHDITHWPVTGTDGFGGFGFGAPVELKGRWEDKSELFLDDNNEEVVSQAIAYFDVDLDLGDFLALGLHALIADPTTLTGTSRAYRIRQFNKITDLRNLNALRKAYL